MIATFMSPDFIQRFAGSLLHFVWQGGIIAMSAAIVLRLMASRSANSRYIVSVIALFLMLAAPVTTFLLYAQTGVLTLRVLQSISENMKGSTQSAAAAAATATWTQWVVLLWFTGVLVCSMRLIAGWRMSRSLVKVGTTVVPSEIQTSFNEIKGRLSLAMPVCLLFSLRIDTPVAIGWLRPAVLLPITAVSGLNELQLRAVFAHELAHIRRHDFLVNLLQHGVESILFYHPAVWWLSSRIRSEREHCCDDLAVQICDDRSAYAQALMELEHIRADIPDLTVAATGGILTQRIHRILGYRIANYDWQSAIAALLFVVVCVTVGVWQSNNTVQAKVVSPIPVPILSPIVLQSEVTPSSSSLTGAVNAIAAIITAQPVQPLEPIQPLPFTQNATAENGVIEGSLRDNSGKPVVGVGVAATLLRTDTVAAVAAGRSETDNNGRYRIVVAPGQYTISAGRAVLPTYYPGTLDAGQSRSVTVSPGSTTANINFALEAMSMGIFRSSGYASSPILSQPVSNAESTSSTQGTLNVYVKIQVEGGGKIPIFTNGHFPKLKVTKIDTNTSYEMWFGEITITIPRNVTTIPTEYKVVVEDLPAEYAVKSITYRADEPGVRLVDVSAQTLKISSRANYQTSAGTTTSTGAPDLPIAITLTRTVPAVSSGIRVTGRSEGIIVVPQIPILGGSPAGSSPEDAGVYLSGKPGILYADGTFEINGVAPGLHSIVLFSRLRNGPSRFSAAEVLVRDRNVEGIALQEVSVLPKNLLLAQTVPAGISTVQALPSVNARMLDESTQQPISSGYITLNGIGGSSINYSGPVFRIPALPGQYSLTATAYGYISKTQSITVGTQETSIDIAIAPVPASSLTVRLLDEDTRQPITTGYVTVNGTGSNARNYGGASNPVFRVPALLSGQYSVTATASGYFSKTQTVNVGSQEMSVDITITRVPK